MPDDILSKLPPEIRLQIWRQMLHSPHTISQRKCHGFGPTISLHPAILRSCRHYYQGPRHVLHAEDTFSFVTPSDISTGVRLLQLLRKKQKPGNTRTTIRWTVGLSVDK